MPTFHYYTTIQSVQVRIACHPGYIINTYHLWIVLHCIRIFFIYLIYRHDGKRILAQVSVRLAFCKTSCMTVKPMNSYSSFADMVYRSYSFMQWPSSVQGVQRAYLLLLEMECQQTSPNRNRTNPRWVADSAAFHSMAWMWACFKCRAILICGGQWLETRNL